jgi:hypothetical protein
MIFFDRLSGSNSPPLAAKVVPFIHRVNETTGFFLTFDTPLLAMVGIIGISKMVAEN